MMTRTRALLVIVGLPVIFSLFVLVRSGGGNHLPVFAAEAIAQYRTDGGMALPDPEVTPGAIDPEIEADLSGASFVVNGVEKNLCAPHFSARAIRKSIANFPKLKRKACEEYGIANCDGSVEGDHLIAIELGGCPDCLTNVWPQPMDEARIKDHQVEDVLPKLICSGEISLADAQRCVATDWVACDEQLREARTAKSTTRSVSDPLASKIALEISPVERSAGGGVGNYTCQG